MTTLNGQRKKYRPTGLKYKKHKENPTSFKKGLVPWNKGIKQTLSRAFDIANGITLCRPCHKKTMGKELQLTRTYFSLIPAQV